MTDGDLMAEWMARWCDMAVAWQRRCRIIDRLERSGLSRPLLAQFRSIGPNEAVSLGEEVLAGGPDAVASLNEAATRKAE